MNLKTESEAIVMKTVNYFLSPRNLCVFASILFLSQNALAGKKYDESGLDGGSDQAVKVKIINASSYTVDKVTVKANCEGESEKSVTRSINLAGGFAAVQGYGVWYLKPNCNYRVIAKAVGGVKKGKSRVLTEHSKNNCEVYFQGGLGSQNVKFGDGCK